MDAYHYATQTIHQPAGSGIYFAVDYDAPPHAIAGSIKDYFFGVAKGFSDASSGNPIYTIGVYGSGCVCDWLQTNTMFVKLTWLSESTGFCGSKTFSRWNMKQSIMPRNKVICGLGTKQAEDNTAQGDFGAFRVLI